MKTLLTLFVLLCSSSVIAEDISDFEIEGISIGDSLLDYYTKDKILNNQQNWYDGDYYFASVFNLNNSSIYDKLVVHYETNDSKFRVSEIEGILVYDQKINQCNDDKDNIVKELSNSFLFDKWEHGDYTDVDGRFTSSFYVFETGDAIGVQCYDWDNTVERLKNSEDDLRVIISSKEFEYWLKNIDDNLVN